MKFPTFHRTSELISMSWRTPLATARYSTSIPSSSFNTNFNIVLPSFPTSAKGPLSFRFSYQKPSTNFSSTQEFHTPRHCVHCHLITWIIFGDKYKSESSSLCSFLTLLFPPSWAQISSSAPYSWTPSAYLLSLMWKTTFHTQTKHQAKLNSFVI